MRINDSVEGRYGEKDKWSPGRIVAINPDGTVDIKYDSGMWNGWSPLTEFGVKPGFFRMQKTGAQSPIVPPSVPPPAPPPLISNESTPDDALFHVGQRVEAKFEGKSKWYGATVMHVNNNGDSFKVKYDGGMWNNWNPILEPMVNPHNIRCYGGEREPSGSFDHSPIRRASDEQSAGNPTSRSGRGRKNSATATQPPLDQQPTAGRMTRAQLAKAEANSKKEVNENAPPPPSTTKKAPNYAMRETNAMRAQREAAMKRRETLEMNEINKYGETFESKKEQKAAAKAEADKKHNFLKRASYSSKVGASSKNYEDPQVGTTIAKTPSGNNKRLSASNQYRSNHSESSTQKQSKQQQLQQYQYQKQNSMQEGRQSSKASNNQLTRPKSLNTDDNLLAANNSNIPQNTNVRASMKNKEQNGGVPVVVIVRKRPAKESETDVIKCLPPIVICNENKQKVDLTKYVHTHKFCYDGSFGELDSTLDLYKQSISPLIDNFMGGGSSTCFCFGQTASGKTFTLFGAGGGQVMEDGEGLDPEAGGVYMLAAQDVFSKLQEFPDLVLSVSMFEIYGQKVRDLLDNGKELAALEDGKGILQLVGLTGEECDTMDDFIATSNVGRLARSTTATGANATSSRSHAAMLLRLVRRGPPKDNKPKPCLGKFSLIDLAGSERGADNENTDKTTQMEGRQINQSLLALKEVIRAKELGRSHAPFRQSRLTQVLEESLTGRMCQTIVIGCISPNEKDIQQTVNTLRYAEGLRPGLKKDMAKKEKEAVAREEARLANLLVEQEAYDEQQQQYSLQEQQQQQRLQQQEETRQMIAAKELELLQMKEFQNQQAAQYQYDQQKYQSQDDENDNQIPRQNELMLLDEEQYEEEQVVPYRDSYVNPVNLNLLDEIDDDDDDDVAPKSIDLDEESCRRTSSWSSLTDGGVGSSAQLIDAQGQFNQDDDDNEEEEEDYATQDSYHAYNGGGGVGDILREQDMLDVEALLAKQERTLSNSGVGSKKHNKAPATSASRSRHNPPAVSHTKPVSTPQFVESPTRNKQPIAQSYPVQDQEPPAPKTAKKPLSNNVANTPSNNNVRNKTQSTSNVSTPATNLRRNARHSMSMENLHNEGSTSMEAELKSLQWRLKVKEDELLEKEQINIGLQNRITDMSRVVEESDKNQANLTSALKRERDRIEAVERTYHEAMMKLEEDLQESAMAREGLEAELEEKDIEVTQLVAEIEDRESRIVEMKSMLKKLLESQQSTAPKSQQRATRSATKSKINK